MSADRLIPRLTPCVSLRVVRFVLLMSALIGLISGAVWAQDDSSIDPVATLEAGDFRALAVMQEGERLLVADAAANQVRVYDITTPDQPELITAVDMSGTPIVMAGAADYTMVGVQTGASTDVIEVIAPSSFNRRRPYLTLTYIDVPAGVRAVSISPDGQWGVAVSAGGYTAMRILAPDEITSLSVDDGRPINDAVVTADHLYLALDGGGVEIYSLDEDAMATLVTTLDVGSTAMELAVNAAGSVVGALTTAGEIALIDANDLALMTSIDADGASALYFLDSTSADALTLDGTREQIRLYDVSSSLALTARGSLNLSTVVRQLITFDNFIFVTDGSTVEILGVR